MIDETDLGILTILQENARTPNAEIARRIGMAPSAVFDRIRKLEDRGVIQEFTVRLAPAALDPATAEQCATIRETYGIDALQDDPELSGITRFAALLFDTPISLVSLLLGDTQHFLARQADGFTV